MKLEHCAYVERSFDQYLIEEFVGADDHQLNRIDQGNNFVLMESRDDMCWQESR